jgi:hypothetical protein
MKVSGCNDGSIPLRHAELGETTPPPEAKALELAGVFSLLGLSCTLTAGRCWVAFGVGPGGPQHLISPLMKPPRCDAMSSFALSNSSMP